MVLEMITGPMYSGKTEELLRRIRREQIAHKKVILFKPSIDDRYSLKAITTHYGNELTAIPVKDTENMLKHLNEIGKQDIIGIDEIQFFDEKIIDFCLKNKEKFHIIASGLNLDFRGEPFKLKDSKRHIGEIMVHAKNISLHAICTHKQYLGICGKDARYTQRLINGEPAPYESPLILVGSLEAYEARCGEHHIVPKQEEFENTSVKKANLN